MGIFSKKEVATTQNNSPDYSSELAGRILDSIGEGVLLVDEKGIIQFANPAAASLAGYESASNIVGLDIHYILRLENSEGALIPNEENTLFIAVQNNQSLSTRDYLLVSTQIDRRLGVQLTCTPTGGNHDFRIITFRDITNELAEEHEKTEFVSTASHEMRTPVASIEGYLGLALNPQTATIDDRAKQYIEQAQKASKHLGNLFRDLLDVTKLDDHRLRPHLVPVDAIEAVKKISDEYAKNIPPRKVRYTFGTNTPNQVSDKKHIEPKVYMAVDLNFLQAIMENIIGNAVKYTPDGGEVWVNARADGDKVLINVTDTGIGISADDLPHVFQKFYRVDNSQTRQIGGTGLGLYLVKQRVEAMGGRVWAESSFGDGSTFYISLPRISDSEFQKLSIAHANEKMVQDFNETKDGTKAVSMAGAGAISSIGVATGVAGASQPANPKTGQLAKDLINAAKNFVKKNGPATNAEQLAAAKQAINNPAQPAQTPTEPAQVQNPAVTPTTTPTQNVTANPTLQNAPAQQAPAQPTQNTQPVTAQPAQNIAPAAPPTPATETPHYLDPTQYQPGQPAQTAYDQTTEPYTPATGRDYLQGNSANYAQNSGGFYNQMTNPSYNQTNDNPAGPLPPSLQ